MDPDKKSEWIPIRDPNGSESESRDSRLWPPLYHEPAIRGGRGSTSSIRTYSNLILIIMLMTILVIIMNDYYDDY